MNELKKSGWRQDLLAALGLVLLSLVFAGVSWGVHKWRLEEELAEFEHEETTVSEVPKVAGFTVISFRELRKSVAEKQSRKEVVVLNARADAFYGSGHIPGALNLDVSEFETQFPALRETIFAANRVLVYCGDRQCSSSKILAQKLRAAGVRNISIYPGGWEEWRKRKGEVEK